MQYILELSTNPAAWIALITLVAMEVVLGIDNLIFISIVTNKLPKQHRSRARRIGISAALLLRLGLLSTVALIVRLTDPVITLFNHGFSYRDMILISGGFFLLWKATKEIHHTIDPDPGPDNLNPNIATASFFAVITQILVLDLIFSIDSIITAVGMTTHIPIMVTAVVIAVMVMLFAADPLANFINDNPTIVMLALGFLLVIGTTLIAEGFGLHIPKGYIYTAMAFSVFIEGLNMVARRGRKAKRSRQTLT